MARLKSTKAQSPEPAQKPSKPSDVASAYLELYSALKRFASRYLRKPHDIEDVVQEACVKALEAQNKRQIDHPKSYLYRTTKNLALKQLARSAYRLNDNVGDFDDLEVIENNQTLESQFEARQQFELFCRAVRQLPLKCRRVFILRRVYGFRPPEIAERLGISIKTVEAHLAKGIVRCTEYMDAEASGDRQSRPEVKGQQRHG